VGPVGGKAKVPPTYLGSDEPVRELLEVIHDLRQPVAAIRYVVDTARAREMLPLSLQDLQDLLDQLDRNAAWMSVLLRQPLSALEAGEGPSGEGVRLAEAVDSTVRLDQLVADVVAQASAGHPSTVQLTLSAAVTVAGSPTALRRALGNVLDNALKAAGPTGTVRVQVTVEDAVASVQVDDDGPGFGRVSSGSRLGLSTAAAVAVAAGGRLEISRSDLTGTRVCMAFPVRTGTVDPLQNGGSPA
jgi:signal transduction histidine kinase